jgi:hypothetical protein
VEPHAHSSPLCERSHSIPELALLLAVRTSGQPLAISRQKSRRWRGGRKTEGWGACRSFRAAEQVSGYLDELP